MKWFREELERDLIGYLVTAQWTVETLLQSIDLFALKRAGLRMWISVADAVDPSLREALMSQDISVRSTYSAQEIGPIGFECEHIPGNYHVATSNVIVEVDSDQSYRLGPHRLGRVLVTHLHSYATPFIRYNIGDLASPRVRMCMWPSGADAFKRLWPREKSAEAPGRNGFAILFGSIAHREASRI